MIKNTCKWRFALCNCNCKSSRSLLQHQ